MRTWDGRRILQVTMRVLLVDDSSEFLSAARRLLEREGVDVAGTAATLEDARRMARELSPDIVLLDIDLGDESGFDVARILHAEDPTRHIVFISSHSAEDFTDLVAESPATGFVSKSRLSAQAIRDALPSGTASPTAG